MDFSIVKLFPDNLMRALCDTLIHSLWQGLILAAATGCIVIFTRKSSPARRYNLLITALVLFTAGTIATFVLNLRQPAPVSVTHITPAPAAYINHENAAVAQAPAQYIDVQKPAFTSIITAFFNRNANVIVLIWFLIVCARSLQLATGLQGVYYLRRKNVTQAAIFWQQRVQQLARALGVKRMIGIAESGLANVPMVVGHLKPLILIPVGLLTALSTEEIETILIHELAHIRRSDYLVNLLQSFVEIVFFFNPAVLWISALIRTERENCCDDIVVAQSSSSKVDYIKALVSCQEYTNASPAFAMALAGKKNHLKNRVTRIISNNNQSLSRVEKSLLAICLVTAALFTAAFTNAEKITKLVRKATATVAKPSAEPAKKPAHASVQLHYADTVSQPGLKIYAPAQVDAGTLAKLINKGYITYLYKEGRTLYQLNYRNNELVSMEINGRTVPSEHVGDYSNIIGDIRQKSKDQLNDNNGPFTTVKDQTNKMYNDAGMPGRTDPHTSQGYFVVDSADLALKARLDKQKLTMSPLGKLDEGDNRRTASADSALQAYKASHGGYTKTKYKPYDAKEAKEYKTDTKLDPMAKLPISPKDYKTEANGYQMIQTAKWKDDERRDAAISDMMKDGLITSRDNLSFKMSNKEFILNGKKQPDDVFEKYKEKYVESYGKGQGEWSWLYNYDADKHRESSTTIANPKN
ncbi:MAG TPA: M56 family metallopeptidase [Mucilaginibacter sp.]